MAGGTRSPVGDHDVIHGADRKDHLRGVREGHLNSRNLLRPQAPDLAQSAVRARHHPGAERRAGGEHLACAGGRVKMGFAPLMWSRTCWRRRWKRVAFQVGAFTAGGGKHGGRPGRCGRQGVQPRASAIRRPTGC